MSQRAFVFDVNETLLDLSALDSFFSAYLQDASLRHVWFATLKEWWLVGVASGVHRPFDELARAALAALPADVPADATEALMRSVTALPAFPAVPLTLHELQERGHRLVALTNGTAAAVEQQLSHAGLTDFFEHILSADEVAQHKPGPKPYWYAADKLGLPIEKCTMVAAHDWDLQGAHRAGMQTIFVARPGSGTPYCSLYPAPTHRIEQLNDVLHLPGV